MRPDRIVVGECRGGETLDMLQAMNTGHDGSLTTVHANSSRDALTRLETMVSMSGNDIPIRVMRHYVSSAINIIMQLTRFSDGSRKLVSLHEVADMEGDTITMQEIFFFKQTGVTADGQVKGFFQSTGIRPRFLEKIIMRGIKVPHGLFDSGKVYEV
jgi:pilus assembly protein CpaF